MRRLVEVVATLAMPAVISEELHLDGILAAAHPLCREAHITRATPVAGLIDPPIPVMRLTHGGASVRLCTSARYDDTARVTTTRFVKRRDDEDIANLTRPINLALGPAKNRLGRLPIVASPTVTWLAVGDRRGIIRLLQRITHLGSWRASGFGFLSGIEVRAIETETPELVLVSGGIAQRHLPAIWCEWSAGETEGPLIAPYWHPARQHERIVPAGTKCALWPAVVEAVHAASMQSAQSAHRGRHRRRNALEAQRRSIETGEPLSNRARREIERARAERERDASA